MTAEGDVDVPACYVCLEAVRDWADFSECECRAAVHTRCLLNAVTASNSLHCSICKGALKNVHVHQSWHVQRTVPCSLRVAVFLCGVTLDVLAIFLLYSGCALPAHSHVLLAIAAVFAFLGTIGFWLSLQLKTLYRDAACVFVRVTTYAIVRDRGRRG